MKIGINCGHTIMGAGYGADGIIKESEETRKVGKSLSEMLEKIGNTVIDCTIDKSDTQSSYLKQTVNIANKTNLDLFISIHFNASGSHEGNGTEVFTFGGKKHKEAVRICENLSKLGFLNRGVKDGSGLYVVKNTKSKAILVEVCFCDNAKDVSLYKSCGHNKIAHEIFNAIIGEKQDENVEENKENHDMTHDQFIEFVGQIALKDWEERKLVLPSIVIAQAIKESSWGKSELAQNANALFGIKQNGWEGRIYYKDATEQNPDGSYRKDKTVAWRAYDSWEKSIIDHNDYIAGRKIGNQSEPNFKEIVGEKNLKRAIAGLVGNEYRHKSANNCTDPELKKYVEEGETVFPYSTSHTYPQSLLSDYIKKYDLERFENIEDIESGEETAPDGMIYVVQAGEYKFKSDAMDFSKKLEKMGIKTIVNLCGANKSAGI